jgi:DNA-binding FrmR family transcriptional regulator
VNGYTEDKDAYLKRMRQYCIDVLTQVSAVNKALEAVALGLLDEHLHHCVADAVAQGGEVADQKVAEAGAAIARLVKS